MFLVLPPLHIGHLICSTLYSPHNAIIVRIWVPSLRNNRMRLCKSRFDYNFSHKLVRIVMYFFIHVPPRTPIYDIRFKVSLQPIHFQKQRSDRVDLVLVKKKSNADVKILKFSNGTKEILQNGLIYVKMEQVILWSLNFMEQLAFRDDGPSCFCFWRAFRRFHWKKGNSLLIVQSIQEKKNHRIWCFLLNLLANSLRMGTGSDSLYNS